MMLKKIFGYPNGVILASTVSCAIILMFLVSVQPKVISTVATREKVVALTVDDGPDPRFTTYMLEVMKKYGARATFFVTGEYAERYPELLKKELAYGCEIANHSYSHPDFKKISRNRIREEIITTNGIISKYTGQNVKWFRPPFGSYDFRVVEEVKKQGMETVMWTCVVETTRTRNPQVMARRVIKEVEPGGIILFHDSRLDRTSTIKALPIIFEELQKRGFKFVTVSELLQGESGGLQI